MMRGLQVIVVLFVHLVVTECHVCMIVPHQRGALDISTSGNPTCFRHGEPCGGQAPEVPKVTFQAGSTSFIKFQQNYNHYRVGFPGYTEVAIATSSNSSEFRVLAVKSDVYVYSQDHQQNITMVMMMPDIECSHCVIRVTYNSHKPGESPFIQCADVKVTKKQGTQLRQQLHFLGRGHHRLEMALRLVSGQGRGSDGAGENFLYGLMYNPNRPGSIDYISVDPSTGEMQTTNTLPFDIGLSRRQTGVGANDSSILNGIVAVDLPRNLTVMLNHKNKNMDTPAGAMLALGSRNGSLVQWFSIRGSQGNVFSAVVPVSFGVYVTFTISENSQKKGTFFFVIGRLTWEGDWTETTRTTHAEDTFINYQWAEYDQARQLLYVLLGNENDADGLSARIYTFDIGKSVFLQFAKLDVSRYTFMSVQLYKKTGQLLAISPGLFSNNYPGYSLVQVDPFQGTVTEVTKVTPQGIFSRYYGGTVYNGVDQERGLLTYVFRVADAEADVIATINLETMATTFSQLTNIRHVYNLARVL